MEVRGKIPALALKNSLLDTLHGMLLLENIENTSMLRNHNFFVVWKIASNSCKFQSWTSIVTDSTIFSRMAILANTNLVKNNSHKHIKNRLKAREISLYIIFMEMGG